MPPGTIPQGMTKKEYLDYLEDRQMEAAAEVTALAAKGAMMPVKGELKYDKDGDPYIPYTVPDAYYDENASLFSHAECEEFPISDTQVTGSAKMFLCKVPVAKAGEQKVAKAGEQKVAKAEEEEINHWWHIADIILSSSPLWAVPTAIWEYGSKLFGDDEDAPEAAGESGKASKGEDAADSKKEAKAADESDKPKKQTWSDKLVIDIEGTSKDVEYVSAGTDIKYQLNKQSEQYNGEKVPDSIRNDMSSFALETAKKIADPGERVTWDIWAFEAAYNGHVKMKRKGWDIKDVDQGIFKNVGWATVTYGSEDKQKRVNVFTGKVEHIKKKPGAKKTGEGDKKSAKGTGKPKGGAKNGGKKKGGKKSGSKGASGYEDL